MPATISDSRYQLYCGALTRDRHATILPGEEVIVPPPGSCGAAKYRITGGDPSVRCVVWFLCFKKL